MLDLISRQKWSTSCSDRFNPVPHRIGKVKFSWTQCSWRIHTLSRNRTPTVQPEFMDNVWSWNKLQEQNDDVRTSYTNWQWKHTNMNAQIENQTKSRKLNIGWTAVRTSYTNWQWKHTNMNAQIENQTKSRKLNIGWTEVHSVTACGKFRCEPACRFDGDTNCWR
jgi:hypothetical protein